MQHPSRRSARVRFEIRPKTSGLRVLSHLDAGLGAEYASAVVPAVGAIEARLRPEVLAERVRVATEVPPAVVLADWRLAARRFADGVSTFDTCILRTDVVECYASIREGAVSDALRRCGVAHATVAGCVRLLRELAAEGIDGLPIGPPASAVLANAVLAAGDEVLVRAGAPFRRWVDDWWIAAGSADRAAEILGRLGSALEDVGLRINEAKTGVVHASRYADRLPSAQYHRAAHAHALSIVTGANAVVPGDRGMGAGGRPARRAHGQR